MSMKHQPLPSGYKQSDAGIIPNDWEPVQIGDLVEFIGGSQPPRSTFSFKPKAGYVRLIQIRDYKTDDFLTYIPETLSKRNCQPDDIMIGRYGPPIFQILRGIEGSYNVALIKAIPKDKILKGYLYYVLKSEALFQLMDLLSQRSSGQTGVDLPALKSYWIGLPPVTEQIAIANALSDVDDLIDSLEQLIAKKRDIKTGTMQKLLTGKTRLPQFTNHPDGTPKGIKSSELGEIPEDWEVNRLSDVCSMKSGASITSADLVDGGVYPCYGGNGLRGYTNTYTHDGTYALVGRQGALCGNVNVASGKFFASEHAVVVTPKKGNDTLWLSVVLERMNLNQYSESSAQPGITVSKIMSLPLLTPLGDEQALIANVLAEMDADIEAIERRLMKTVLLKQGMMQELLTGKTRLV